MATKRTAPKKTAEPAEPDEATAAAEAKTEEEPQPEQAELDRRDAVTLEEGATGDDVEYLQRVLNAQIVAYPPLKVDGEYGSETRLRVAEAQHRLALAPTGAVDKQTWNALGVHRR